MDTNEDGVITEDEFIEGCKKVNNLKGVPMSHSYTRHDRQLDKNYEVHACHVFLALSFSNREN
jgi:hypothetical protein